MLRQPMALLAGASKKLALLAGGSPVPAHKRKVFLFVFLWTCLCLLLFRATMFAPARAPLPALDGGQAAAAQRASGSSSSNNVMAAHQTNAASKVRARSAVSAAPTEFASGASLSAGYKQRAASVEAATTTGEPVTSQHLRQNSNSKLDDETPQRAPGGGLAAIVGQINQKQTDKSAPTSRQPGERRTPVAGSACHYDYPSLFDLQFNNIHWQRMTTKWRSNSASNNTQKQAEASTLRQATFYLYNAYYDDRWRAGLASVRLLAMIDSVKPPPTNCLLWSSKLTTGAGNKLRPIVTRASFLYAWYPKWGNYKDGILQPWIVTCPVAREHAGLVPDSVTLVEVPPELPSSSLIGGDQLEEDGRRRRQDDENDDDDDTLEAPAVGGRRRRQADSSSIAIPPSFSSSSSAHVVVSSTVVSKPRGGGGGGHSTKPMQQVQYNCQHSLPLTNNLPVFNRRPQFKQKFAVCVKGLDFPHNDVSVRLVEWIEMLNLLGASKIFLYELDVHENITKVLHYYQQRGIVELSPLTLPGDQPNLPEYQHLYLKNKLTAKRQNELIPYNDCLYRNLYSYEYLALLDIDEIIMPLGKHHNWYDLMQQVEELSLGEQNYSRASYNVRNVYFFDDLSGPMGTTSTASSSLSNLANLNDFVVTPEKSDDTIIDGQHFLEKQQQPKQRQNSAKSNNNKAQIDSAERGIPHYLHMMSHVYRSKNYTEPGQYVKCFHNTERVVSLHNHFPMNCFGQCTTYSIPVNLAHLQHYRKDCVGPLRQSCKNDFRVFTMRDTTIWKYKQRMIKRTTRVLNHLGLLAGANQKAL